MPLGREALFYFLGLFLAGPLFFSNEREMRNVNFTISDYYDCFKNSG